MKTAMPVASVWALLLGLLALLLVQPATAQFGGGGIPSGAVTGASPTVAPTKPPTTATGGAAVPPAVEDEEEEPVVVDILVAGATEEQKAAIATFINFLKQSTALIPSHEKIKNATAEWEHTHVSADKAHKEEKGAKPRRALRNKPVIAPKVAEEGETDAALNRTRCTLVMSGGNYSVVHVTLHGKAQKMLVEKVIDLITDPNFPSQLLQVNGVPILDFVCKTNVRMQSEAPPADFAPMAEKEEGLTGGQKAGIAVGVIGGAAAVGAVGYFAFHGFGAAAGAV